MGRKGVYDFTAVDGWRGEGKSSVVTGMKE